MALLPSRASLEDDAAFAAFSCIASATQSTAWLEEVENYVRARVLRDRDQHVLAFREEDELVAVSAFRKSELELPIQPAVHPAWHLEVLAVADGRQRAGVGLQVLDHTLSAMREIDSERVFVVAVAHRDNDASIALCAKRGITRFVPHGAYWVLVGELT
jgi:ribosomal protein S18 acetylase RimI-like enzyme